MSYVAPAGTRLRASDFVAGLGAGLLRPGSREALSELLSAHSGQSHCWPMVSGRAAMTLLFGAMKQAAADPRRCEVVVPGFTCYSVPAAAERAGLKVRLIDVDPRTLDMDLEALKRVDFSRVLSIVTANLYGVPNALPKVEAVAAANRVFMLDDAAQSLGARVAGRAVGGFGDAGLYSFDKGKVITTIQGGAIVARAGALATAIASKHAALDGAGFMDTAEYVVKLGIYGVLLKPALYGVVQSLPGLGLGQTRYETVYPLTRYSTLLSGVALRLARRLDTINDVRIGNARRLHAALADHPGLRMLDCAPDASPVFTRFPLFVTDPKRRAPLLAALNAAGIGATASYPNALGDVPEVQRILAGTAEEQSGARAVAATLFTLPTHAYSPPDLATRVRAIVDQWLGRGAP
jgi:perosamine synthetase